MNRIKYLFILLISAQTLMAQTKVGATAANFLTIPVGPKATAMGGAFVAEANDATTIFWNPAGISRLPKSEFSAVFSEWLVDTRFNWFGISYKLSDDDAVGVSINQLDYGEDMVTTEDYPDGTGEKWSAQDIALSITYAKNLTDRFSVGATVKYIRQQIWHESANAFALDIGLLFHTQLPGLRLGMNITNFGTEMKMEGKDLFQPIDRDRIQDNGNNSNVAGSFNTDSWPLPLIFTVGLGYELFNDYDIKSDIAVDAVYPNNQTSYMNAGAEITWNDMIAVRVGMGSIFKEAKEEGICAGFGLKYDFGPLYTKIDYSYNDFGIFGDISKIGVTIGF